jgi:hypothetical protein
MMARENGGLPHTVPTNSKPNSWLADGKKPPSARPGSDCIWFNGFPAAPNMLRLTMTDQSSAESCAECSTSTALPFSVPTAEAGAKTSVELRDASSNVATM